MPKSLEEKLKMLVAKKNWLKERKETYVYGTLQKKKKKVKRSDYKRNLKSK